MERLRAGVIGVGAIAQIMHLPYLRELDDRFEIAALCDVDPVALEEVGRHMAWTASSPPPTSCWPSRSTSS